MLATSNVILKDGLPFDYVEVLLHHSLLEHIYLTLLLPFALDYSTSIIKTCVPVPPQKDKNKNFNCYIEHIRFLCNPAAFQLRFIPTSSISTLSTPIWSTPTSSTSHFVNSHFVNSHLVNVDKIGIDKVGIDKVGIDKVKVES